MNVATEPSMISAVAEVAFKAGRELRDWFTRRRAQAKALEENELNAVRALNQAVMSTTNYIGRLEAGKRPVRKHEEELSKLWSDAALAFYVVNREISPLLHLKALSWSRPAKWIEEEVVKSGISLDEMNKLLMDLLGPARKR